MDADVLLGNDQDAADRIVLNNNKISHVINVTSHIPLHFESDGLKYRRFPASDSGIQNLRQYFEEAISFIGQHFNDNKKDICTAPHSKKLTAEALRCVSHSFHTAYTPHLPLPVTFHQRAPPV